jgi:hypothetical protein
MSSKAVVKEAVEDGAVSRREIEGLRVEVDETTERVSGSRLERVESPVRRRRASSSLELCEADELPVNRLHMVMDAAQRARVCGYEDTGRAMGWAQTR